MLKFDLFTATCGLHSERDLSHFFIPVSVLAPSCTGPKSFLASPKGRHWFSPPSSLVCGCTALSLLVRDNTANAEATEWPSVHRTISNETVGCICKDIVSAFGIIHTKSGHYILVLTDERFTKIVANLMRLVPMVTVLCVS